VSVVMNTRRTRQEGLAYEASKAAPGEELVAIQEGARVDILHFNTGRVEHWATVPGEDSRIAYVRHPDGREEEFDTLTAEEKGEGA
jgi:galactokinase